ncbi:MAG TPA: AgmX/PglI C-terminal domain-containing protein, partial [Kofleriaceae bacterium]|nr:AgmX/PglI C-terminal domain-containing protein [Kofleriaceae bacterium]
VLLSACNSDPPDARPVPSDVPPVKQPNLPRVDDPDIVLSPALAPQPAAFVWIGPSGKLELGVVGPIWDGKPPTTRHLVIMPSEVRTEVLQAALTSNDAIRGAAQAQMLGKGTPAATIDSARQSTAAIVRDAELDAVVPIVSANPTTPAVAVARALVRTGGMIAVTDDRGAKVLQVGALPAAAHAATSWVELHVDVDGIHVIQIPSGERHEVAWNNGQLDRGWLRLAYTKLSTTPAGATDPDIDVLLGDDVNTQMLVDIIVVLRDVGAKHLFVGVHPPGAVADRIIQPRPPTAGGNVLLGQPVSQGDLDKAIIRRYMRRNIQKFQYCYEKQLLVNGNLAGTVSTQFFISPEGTVARADASGVDPEVAGCVAGVIKDIEFPKPRGGGGVQVNYPLTLQLVAP